MRKGSVKGFIGFICEAFPGLPKFVEADETRLRQVLFNLLSNAAKCTPSGMVKLEVSTMDNHDLANPTIRFEVTDTGIEIEKNDLEKIFKPFEQVGKQAMGMEGTGLGLAITKSLTELMGGKLNVESEPGKGSRFWFDVKLPVGKEITSEATIRDDVTGYKGKRLTALVTDDNAANLALMTGMLEQVGFRTLTAINGREEVDVAKQSNVDIILTDLKMPVMGGYSAAREIRKISEMKNTPITAVSASVMEDDKRLCKEAGCNAFLAKPVKFNKLLEILQKELKLEWIYEKDKEEKATSETATSTDIISPPPEQIQKLSDAAKRGSVTELKESISEIKKMGLEYHPFVVKIEAWARNYQFEEIVDFLEQDSGEAE